MAKVKQLPQNEVRTLEKNIAKVTLYKGSDAYWYVFQTGEPPLKNYVQVCEEFVGTFLPELNASRAGQTFEIELGLANDTITEVENPKKKK